jgi:hypothetical protein
MQGMEGELQAACAIHADRQAVTTCARCGTFSCQECLSESPPGELFCAACVARATTSQLPWDHREELGWARAWFKSVSAILFRPTATFSTAKSEGDVGGSILFMTISWFVGCFTTFVAFALIGALIPSFIEESSGDADAAPVRLILVTTYGVMALVVPLFGVASTLVMAALEHLVMMMFGKPRGFETTLRAASLSLAPYAFGVIPVCSLYVAPLWVLVVKVFAYKGMHRTTIGTAILGALAIPALGVLLGCGLYLAVLSLALAAGKG